MEKQPKTTKDKALIASVPANNEKIVQIYNKIKSGQLTVNKDYQRKLVWKISHKINFIDTILNNYPFPEVYIAPSSLDPEKILLKDEIVDGQQRLTAIVDYIEDKDIFSTSKKLPIKKFSELNTDEKKAFLNYEVSIRYLKDATPAQIKEIFQRINKTDYALNSMERINAQWGESEFICVAKQIVDPEFKSDSAITKFESTTRKEISSFFLGNINSKDSEGIFSENDVSRMLALQYIMVLIATMITNDYFNRNEKIESFIKTYNESFAQAEEIVARLHKVIQTIKAIKLNKDSRWFNKANLFTLIIELDKFDLTKVNIKKLKDKLELLDKKFSMKELDDLLGVAATPEYELTSDEVKFLHYSGEAVNQKSARVFRGHMMQKLIKESISD